ncbi:MAG: hypothetical protein ABIE07_05870 [Candidatus Zixiibacteriota bacterium]
MRNAAIVKGFIAGIITPFLILNPCQSKSKFNPSNNSNLVFQRPAEGEFPNFAIEVHKINKLWLSVTNSGMFGTGFADTYIDPETGRPAPSCEYPAGSDITYLYIAAIWAGAVVGRDTLVSVGSDGNYDVNEFWPDAGERGAFIRQSIMRTSHEYSPDAVSEQDYICIFTDTNTSGSLTGEDPVDNRPHVPLGLEVTQRSYAWSYDYAEDFIILDYSIRNINRFPLKDLYLGIYVDADVYHASHQGGFEDDICGYLHSIPSFNPPGFEDTVRIAWNADNDGDPNLQAGNIFDFTSSTSATGTSVLRTPNPDLQLSFNWWIAHPDPALDWGPRLIGSEESPFRDFGTGMGRPSGDLNKYHIMSNDEFDYDQLESAVNHSSEGWLGPPQNSADFADGFDNRYLFSFGPFDIQPGDTLPITLAYVAGEDFHVRDKDFSETWDPHNPYVYMERLDMSDIGRNAMWANWVFDNPGFDTDGDGDSGSVRWVIDSLTMDSTAYFYAGDGIADFRGAAPPPPPPLNITSEYGKLRIRWNGELSETNIDVFSGLRDFEGYRVYFGEDNRQDDYILVTSYDLENYNMYTWDARLQMWNQSDIPLSMDSITTLFEPGFDPNQYLSPDDSYLEDGNYFYFRAQDWNQSSLSNPQGIRKIYPDADPNDLSDTTENGHHRFYEYEYILDNLQASVPYYVSVTAFDFGSRKAALSVLESAPNLSAVQAYALPSVELVEAEALNVKVFPNPYRIDGGYAADGYENRDRTRSAERTRAINFTNLPKICTIRIFTLAGDLIKLINHFEPDGGPKAQRDTWNVVSRNTQAITTGIYIYTVSSEMGEQIGKIVIMK